MSISNVTVTITEAIQLARATSGFGNATVGPTSISFTSTVTSGQLYTTQQVISSGSTASFDIASGALTDQVNSAINIATVYGVVMTASSGAALLKTAQSGGINNWFLSSGSSALVPPGCAFSYHEPMVSGNGLALANGNGNLNVQAVSGACLLTLGIAGR